MALFCKRQTDQKDRPKSLALKNLENPKTPQKLKILQNPKILSPKILGYTVVSSTSLWNMLNLKPSIKKRGRPHTGNA